MPNPHPFVVHFPIALFIGAVICELLAYFFKSKLLSEAGLVASITSVAAALTAVITGLLAASIVPEKGLVREVLESHETLGYLVLAASTCFAALKLYSYVKNSDRYLVSQIALGLIGAIITILAAHEGGELVYQHGVGVDASQKNVAKYPIVINRADSLLDSSKAKK